MTRKLFEKVSETVFVAVVWRNFFGSFCGGFDGVLVEVVIVD